ncbi:MAG: hypothetical protein AB9869_18080 [Verrucomicrobiia bacterium]
MKDQLHYKRVSDGQSLRPERRKLRLGMVWLAALAQLPAASADVFNDALCSGIDAAYLLVQKNQPLYTVEATAAGVKFSKPAGGIYTFQYVSLQSRAKAQGNFDVRVNYTNASIARIDGNPGNQVQLKTQLGGQYFGLVRSDEAAWGQNVHVWTDPPAAGYGVRSVATNSGVMRVTRTGPHVQAYLDGTLIYEANCNTNDATFWLSLQNNGTRDATAVTFANLQLAADHIVYEPNALSIQLLSSQQVLISWPANPSGYLL